MGERIDTLRVNPTRPAVTVPITTLARRMPPAALALVPALGLLWLVSRAPLPAIWWMPATIPSLLPLLGIASAAWLVARLQGWLGIALGLLLTTALFLGPVNQLWSGVSSNTSTVHGLLPWSDASSYYTDALRLLEGTPVSQISARRPLHPAVTAALLWLTGRNLQTVVVLWAFLAGVAACLAAREAGARFGAVTAAATFVIQWLFYRQLAGSMLTESMGLCFGAIGVACLVRATIAGDLWTAAIGLFVLGLANQARAGALFVLPAVALWIWLYAPDLGAARLRAARAAALALILPLFINAAAVRFLAVPEGKANGNFAYVFYGLAVDGETWMQSSIDHPALGSLTEQQRVEETFRLAIEAVKENPRRIVKALGRRLLATITPAGTWVFLFMWGPEPATYLPVVTVLLLLHAIALVWAWHNRRDLMGGLLLAYFIGWFMSVPFLRDGGYRVLAATTPLTAIAIGVGLRALLAVGRARGRDDAPEPQASHRAPLTQLAMALSFFAVLGPVVAYAASSRPVLPREQCASGETLYLRLTPGSRVDITNGDGRHLFLPALDVEDARRLAQFGHGGGDFAKELAATTTPGRTIRTGIDLNTSAIVWIVAPTGDDPPGVVRACGAYSGNTTAREFGLFVADRLERGALVLQ